MKQKNIRQMPKYMLEKIRKMDKAEYPNPDGHLRFYAYLAIWQKELVKVTVAVKHKNKKWYFKQVAVHGLHANKCYVKDILFTCMSGYTVGWFEQGLTNYPKWYESKEWGYADDKYFDPYAPIANKEIIDEFPEYKYSAYKLYNGVDILQYLRLYERYPHIEYLVKTGLQSLIKSKMIVNLSAKDKKFCKWLILNKTEITTKHYDVKVVLRAYKTGKSLDCLRGYEQCKKALKSDSRLKPIAELFKGNLERFFCYLGKQNTNANTYLDYLNACNYLGLDMSLNKNKMPHDFKRWHDIRIDEYNSKKAIEDEHNRKELYKQFASVAEKYLPLQKDNSSMFIAVIAKSPADLIKEGEILHHCVGRMNYDQKMIREETLIFFIRNKKAPDIPLVTVEYSVQKHKVLQCYGDNDSVPDSLITNYVNKIWLPYANRQLKKLKIA